MTQLSLGEPVPWFHAQALNGNPRFCFDTAAGRWMVFLLVESAARDAAQDALRLVAENRDLFDDARACFFGVTTDPADAAEARIVHELPGLRWFLDYDRTVSGLYGAIGNGTAHESQWLIIDPMLRVAATAPIERGAEIMAQVRALATAPSTDMIAPVLIVPNVFTPDFCRHLIGLYEKHGGQESGFMREENGITTIKLDPGHKRRADHVLTDARLIATLKQRMGQALVPMIRRAFQFEATRIERFIVACYDAESGGHFRPHRDNTTKGTAHRKFACTLNLNAEDYDGGELCFPEFGRRTYRAPTGGAVIFSCSLLHEAQPVTRGRRFVFLPFLYDDAGAWVRENNLTHVAPELKHYRSGLRMEANAA